jgi:hypothetical protein
MLSPSDNDKDDQTANPLAVHFSIEGDAEGHPAWTEIEKGRFLPRRVRGSCQGRALG